MRTQIEYLDYSLQNLDKGKWRRKRSDLFQRIADHWTFYLCIAPFFVLFFIFGAYPIIASLYESLTRWDGLSEPVYIGIGNYISLFRDPTFLTVIINTLSIWLGSTVLTLSLAFLLAFLVNYYVSYLHAFLRVAFLFPLLIAPSLTAVIVSVLFSTNSGLVNAVMSFFVGHKVVYDWFSSGFWIKPLIILMIIWRWTGWHFTLFLS